MDDSSCAVRRRVPDGVRYAQARCASTNRRGEQRAQRVRIGACRVLGHIHHPEPFPDRKRDGFLGGLLQVFKRPPFHVLPNRAGTDERAAFDRHAGALDDLGDWLDVGGYRAGGAIWSDGEPQFADRLRQALDVCGDVRTGTRQADVRGFDAERVHSPKQVDLLVD